MYYKAVHNAYRTLSSISVQSMTRVISAERDISMLEPLVKLCIPLPKTVVVKVAKKT